VHVIEQSVYDLDLSSGGFDAVAMVGVIEHMPDHHRALSTVSRLLRRNGRLYLSASCYRSWEKFDEYVERASSRHTTETIFGYGTLRPLSDLLAAAEDANLSPSRITDLTSHYHRTVEDWLAGVEANEEQIDALVPGMSAELTRYLNTTNAGWGYTTKHYAFTAVHSRWGATELPQ
jgi:cyclopropane-fatty-acyl-phospholipid synthase